MATLTTCKSCSAELPHAAKFCRRCGSRQTREKAVVVETTSSLSLLFAELIRGQLKRRVRCFSSDYSDSHRWSDYTISKFFRTIKLCEFHLRIGKTSDLGVHREEYFGDFEKIVEDYMAQTGHKVVIHKAYR